MEGSALSLGDRETFRTLIRKMASGANHENIHHGLYTSPNPVGMIRKYADTEDHPHTGPLKILDIQEGSFISLHLGIRSKPPPVTDLPGIFGMQASFAAEQVDTVMVCYYMV